MPVNNQESANALPSDAESDGEFNALFAQMLVSAEVLDEQTINSTSRVVQKLGGDQSLFKILEKRGTLSRETFLDCVRSQQPDIPIGALLHQLGAITRGQWKQAEQLRSHSGNLGDIGQILVSKQMLREEQFTEAKAAYSGYQYEEPDIGDCDSVLLKSLPIRLCKLFGFLPIRRVDNGVVVAFESLDRGEARTEAAHCFKTNIEPVLCSGTTLRRAFAAYERQVAPKSEAEQLAAKEGSASAWVSNILKTGIELSASDIHVQPTSDGVRVRFRIDGALRDHQQLPLEQLDAMVSRLKIMAEANIAERRKHQDGRINFEDPETGGITELRASFFITINGEAVVLRVLRNDNRIVELKKLGMGDKILTLFRKEALEAPNGVIIVTGPTGSGKTSTLYSCVQHLNDDTTSIITAEDPVEYQVDGISQCSINAKLGRTYEDSLRFIVRQDPDVIVLGEIRDATSARSAIQASLTGHKVLTTFHAEDTIGTLLRLMYMDIEKFLIASTVSCVLAQRLVRKVCTKCAKQIKPKPSELKQLGWSLDSFHGGNFREGVGCEHCDFTGYKGRIAIFEVLILNAAVRDAILDSNNATDIRRTSQESAGLITLLEHGLVRASRGETSVKEVIRVLPRLSPPRPLMELIRLTGIR